MLVYTYRVFWRFVYKIKWVFNRQDVKPHNVAKNLTAQYFGGNYCQIRKCKQSYSIYSL